MSLPVAEGLSASRKKFGYFRIAVIRPRSRIGSCQICCKHSATYVTDFEVARTIACIPAEAPERHDSSLARPTNRIAWM